MENKFLLKMKNSSKSQALVLVLVIVTIFAAIIVTIGSLTARELEMREVDEMALNANYAAESGWERAKFILKGSALSFDGVDDYVLIKNTGPLIAREPNSTIEAWVKLNTDITSEKAIYDESTSTGTVFRLRMRSDKKPEFSFQIGSTFYMAVSSETVQPNKWYHLVGTFSSSEGMKIYVNGKLTGINANTSICGYNPIYVWIGRYKQEGYYFPGVIDEVRVYKRTLSLTEIQDHYNGKYTNESGLFLLQHFEEGPTCQSGACLSDDSGNSNNCTPTNFSDLSAYDKSNSGWTRAYPSLRNVFLSFNPPASCPDAKVSSVLCDNDENPMGNEYFYSAVITANGRTKPDGEICNDEFCITYSGETP